MIVFLFGAALAYAALAGSSLLIRTEDWWETHPTTSAAVLTLGLVPLLSTWAAAELVRLLRAPKLLTPHAGVVKRIVAGLTAGLISCATGALTIVLLEPPNGGLGWLMMGVCAFVSTTLVLLPAKRIRRGHCRRCDYDLAGVTTAAHGKCPECGLDLMAAV